MPLVGRRSDLPSGSDRHSGARIRPPPRPLAHSSPLRRPSGQRPPRRLCRAALRIEVGEDLLDHAVVPDTGDVPHRLTADRTGPELDAEHPFQALRSGHPVSVLDGRGYFRAAQRTPKELS